MSQRRIELIEVRPGDWTVIADGAFADRLCDDEALGVIAAAIYSNRPRLPYVRSYEEWVWFQRRYMSETFVAPAALLTWNGRPLQ